MRAIESTDPSGIRSRFSHRHVIKWKKALSTRILRLCLVSWKIVRALRGKTEVEKPADRLSGQPLLIYNYSVCMENQLSSSGAFSQESRHCRFFRRCRVFCDAGIPNLEILVLGSSSCLCSTTLIGQRKGYEEKCISNSEEVNKYAK